MYKSSIGKAKNLPSLKRVYSNTFEIRKSKEDYGERPQTRRDIVRDKESRPATGYRTNRTNRTDRTDSRSFKEYIKELETQLRDEKMKRIRSETLISEYLNKKKGN